MENYTYPELVFLDGYNWHIGLVPWDFYYDEKTPGYGYTWGNKVSKWTKTLSNGEQQSGTSKTPEILPSLEMMYYRNNDDYSIPDLNGLQLISKGDIAFIGTDKNGQTVIVPIDYENEYLQNNKSNWWKQRIESKKNQIIQLRLLKLLGVSYPIYNKEQAFEIYKNNELEKARLRYGQIELNINEELLRECFERDYLKIFDRLDEFDSYADLGDNTISKSNNSEIKIHSDNQLAKNSIAIIKQAQENPGSVDLNTLNKAIFDLQTWVWDPKQGDKTAEIQYIQRVQKNVNRLLSNGTTDDNGTFVNKSHTDLFFANRKGNSPLIVSKEFYDRMSLYDNSTKNDWLTRLNNLEYSLGNENTVKRAYAAHDVADYMLKVPASALNTAAMYAFPGATFLTDFLIGNGVGLWTAYNAKPGEKKLAYSEGSMVRPFSFFNPSDLLHYGSKDKYGNSHPIVDEIVDMTPFVAGVARSGINHAADQTATGILTTGEKVGAAYQAEKPLFWWTLGGHVVPKFTEKGYSWYNDGWNHEHENKYLTQEEENKKVEDTNFLLERLADLYITNDIIGRPVRPSVVGGMGAGSLLLNEDDDDK